MLLEMKSEKSLRGYVIAFAYGRLRVGNPEPRAQLSVDDNSFHGTRFGRNQQRTGTSV
jgi:hypothetical protein